MHDIYGLGAWLIKSYKQSHFYLQFSLVIQNLHNFFDFPLWVIVPTYQCITNQKSIKSKQKINN